MSSGSNPLFALHQTLLVLPNAWDALSARIVEEAGARAIATTSAAVAWKHGYADGQHVSLEQQVATVAEIARVVRVPITCDIERGYSDSPEEVASAIARLVEAGAHGVNLEDGGHPDVLVAKIRAVKARLGERVFVNARSDLRAGAAKDYLASASAYEAAGADGFFAIWLSDEAVIREVANGTRLPLNLVVHPGVGITKLAALGARRLSAGPGIARAAYSAARAAARAMLQSEPFHADLTYPEANTLLQRK